jgi:hypothetical protein
LPYFIFTRLKTASPALKEQLLMDKLLRLKEVNENTKAQFPSYYLIAKVWKSDGSTFFLTLNTA